LVASGEVFDEARRLDALFVGHVRVGAQHFAQFGSGFGVVVFVRAGQGNDQTATHIVRDAVHVINFGRQQQFADIREHGVWNKALAIGVCFAINTGCYTASVKTFSDGDEFDHLFA
jgi:hypothetical protein